jgi:prolipoprotein diacylglyceryltransferase
MLGLLEQAPRLHLTLTMLIHPGGRTTVGGLLGGWIAVALSQRRRNYPSTSDLLALPLCLGIAVGRLGCFLSGLADGTQGLPTRLPWGINFGDGILRHPTPVYEILFLTALAGILSRYQRRPHPDGTTFRIFMAAYLAWRVLIDFIKPEPLLYGLSMIQWASVLGLLVLLPGIMRLLAIHPSAIRSNP